MLTVAIPVVMYLLVHKMYIIHQLISHSSIYLDNEKCKVCELYIIKIL